MKINFKKYYSNKKILTYYYSDKTRYFGCVGPAYAGNIGKLIVKLIVHAIKIK
jgi:hypothetical protein